MASTVSVTEDALVPDAHASTDSGLRCLMLIAALHGIPADEESLRRHYGRDVLFDTQSIVLAARSLGFHSRQVTQDPVRLHLAPLPAMAQGKDGQYFILAKVDQDAAPGAIERGRVLIQRAGEPPQVLSLATFLAQWTGELIFFTSKASFVSEVSRFDFTWFIPAVPF